MEVLLVTGGIGSGKSEVCRIIHEIYGCGIYCADKRVKELYGEYPDLIDRIEAALNVSVRDGQGCFRPEMLAAIIFNDRKLIETVEKIVFPVLMDDFNRWKSLYLDERFVVFESATVLEKPQFKGFCDKVIIVDAPFEVRLERACRRDSQSREKILARMKNQTLMNRISEGDVVPDADALICNDGDLSGLVNIVRKTVDLLYM